MLRLIIYIVAACLGYVIKSADGSGTVTLTFTKYQAIGKARKDGGSWCDKLGFLSFACDTFLEICFDPNGGDDCDKIYSDSFKTKSTTFPELPSLVFPVTTLVKGKLKLRLFDLDHVINFRRHNSQFLGLFTDEFPLNVGALEMTTLTTNGLHSISYKAEVLCDKHFFGVDCGVLCQPADTDQDGHYSCNDQGNILCLPGYEDPSSMPIPCITITDMCSPNLCQSGGSCVQNAGEITASCDCSGTGFTGERCETDIDECALNPCVNGGICQQGSPGTFNCMCGPYFEGLRCEITTDICQLQANACMHGGTCSIVSVGVTMCACAPGYEGNRCQTNIDECAASPCANNGICTQLSPPNFMCTCLPETTGPRCELFLNPCSTNGCKNGGSCIPGNFGLFQCMCAAGFSGDTCEVDDDACLSQPCLNSGRCTDTIGGFFCCCQEGFTGDTCESSRQVVNLFQFLQSFNFVQLFSFRSVLANRCPSLTFTSFFEVVLQGTQDSNCFYGSFFDEARAAGRDVDRVTTKQLAGLASPLPVRQ